MLRLALTVILAILGIFVHPFGPGIVDFIYRFLVFSGITYIAYITFKNAEPEQEIPVSESEPTEAIQNADLEISRDREWNLQELIKSDDRTRSFINDQFVVMGNLLMPDNGWVFLKSSDRTLDKFQYENFSGNGHPVNESRFHINGVLQILDTAEKVIIENNIENQANLLTLYDGEKYTVSSFLGIPMFLPNEQKMFFCFDSGTKEHFNQEDAKVIYKIVEGVETFVVNRLKAYTLLAEIRETNALLDFAQTLNGCKTVGLAMDQLVELMSKKFEATRLTLSVLKKDSGNGVIKKVIGQKDDFEENTDFPLEEGLTGWVIGKNKPYLLDDIEKGEYFIPRYTKSEKSNYGLHSFLGIPLGSGDQVYGALTLEHVVPGKYTELDKDHVQHLAAVFSTVFNRLAV